MDEKPVMVFRNHLQRAKYSVDLALNMKGAEELKGQPVVKILAHISSTLNEVVSAIDEAVKDERGPSEKA